jgi:hypothetical protein
VTSGSAARALALRVGPASLPPARGTRVEEALGEERTTAASSGKQP